MSGDPAGAVRVAVGVPLRRPFDFTAGEPAPAPGTRVLVPFGHRRLVGVVLGPADGTRPPTARLKPILRVLDLDPVFDAALFDTLCWAAAYYHHPLGEVLLAALPPRLRNAQTPALKPKHRFKLSALGQTGDLADLRRAPLQRTMIEHLRSDPGRAWAAHELAAVAPRWTAAVAALRAKGWIDTISAYANGGVVAAAPSLPQLTPRQQDAVDAIIASLERYHCFLLHGVTGSGKTEVYLQVAAECLARDRQALVMVPEIALTPQLVERFRARFGNPVAVLHSGLPAGERHRVWGAARCGDIRVVLGTRSAVFTPFHCLGVIIVDEEHDPSYKQQEGFRYHARDLAIYRGRAEGVPVVLGSATPSLESLANVQHRRHTLLELPERVGGAQLPEVRLVDMRGVAGAEGLAPALVTRLRQGIASGEQSLIYLNRRGFAPVLLCTQCQWVASCERCDARLTFHKSAGELRCHHCGQRARAPAQCPECATPALESIGEGTQRIEESLRAQFPEAAIVRIDRDATRSRERLEERLREASSGRADILVGTQLLGKGHDFPQVTTVGVVNADQGLFSVDFRALEHLFQRVIQVAGRAGRAQKPGVVLVQTRYPEHPYWSFLQRHDYLAFAAAAARERRAAHCPPFSYFALLRSESTRPDEARAFLEKARAHGSQALDEAAAGIRLMDVVASPMEKLAGRYRAQLLVVASRRAPLHGFLTRWLDAIENLPLARRVRWSIDVDPIDMY